MTKRQRWILPVAALGTAGALLLAGCGGQGGDEAAADHVEMVWPGTSDPEIAIAEEFAEEVLEEDGITIEYNFMSWADIQKQMAVRIQSGDVPDATQTQDVTDLVRLGGLAPLDDRFEESGIDADNFRNGTLEYSTVDGKLYSIPVIAQTWHLLVNEELLNEAGWSAEDLATWDDLEKAAAAITETGTPGFGYALGAPRFAYRLPLVVGYSDGLNIGDVGEGTEEQWREVLEHLKALVPSRPSADVAWDSPDQFRAFANGEVGMIQAGSFMTANMYSLAPDIIAKTVQIPYPHGPAVDEAQVPVSSLGIGIFEDAKNPEAAWTVTQRLISEDWSNRMAAVVNTPVLKSVTPEDLRADVEKVYPEAADAQIKQIGDQMAIIDDYGVPFTQIPGQPEMEPELQEILVSYLSGETDIDQAIADIQDRIGAIVERNK